MKKSLLFAVFSLVFIIGSAKPLYSQVVDLYLDDINVYVNKWGKIAIYTLPDTIRQVYQATALVGTGPEAVFDYYNDTDYEDSTRLLSTPTFGDYEIYGSYNNYGTAAPPNVLEKVNVYCWQNLNSILVKFTIINRESSSIDAICGLELVPEVEGSYSGGDTVIFSSATQTISVKKTEFVGFRTLSDNFKSLGAFIWNSDYPVDSTFYSWLTYNSFDSPFITDPNDPNVDDPVLIPAYNTKTIASGDSVIIYFAIAYGVNEAAMIAGLEQIQQKYNQLVSVESDLNNIPSDYILNHNYPNPFNPSTKISFGLPQRSNVLLRVFNALGEQVAELMNGSLEAGTHTYNFDASGLTSGIYIYSLQTDAGIISNKMTLIK